ncbi:Myb-like DNA-binding domain containing protein [Tritrichomonas foetus]|uniref:Myb-like DNA-binding domain containing protein n=1 Tax=Tritrichomonas foetus TaxID=1144522 RepID=A0A1J4JAI1_9EUKA|nr:Myb-like DNA-binding domain containing protein [Tritrichomonas foetus]|eukprot:OHS94659.1 Myb-like DNA-binding domain containing protein [Tritrichomonas foetus]
MMSDHQVVLSNIPAIPQTILMQSLMKGATSRRNFTKEEDQWLNYLVDRFGTKNWNQIAEYMPLRNARQCKERFLSYLSPNINLNPWTAEEDALLIKMFKEYGPKWVKISKSFDGRSDNNLKNRWYTHLKKICEKQPEVTVIKKENSFEQPQEEIDGFDCSFFALNEDIHDYPLDFENFNEFEFVNCF